MDGLGFRKYIIERTKGRIENSIELADAFKDAPNPGLMVLDALDGFWGWGSNSDLTALRRACAVLLEELMKAQAEIENDAKERARTVASVWKKNMKVVTTVVDGSCGGDEEKEERESLEKLGYLLLLATYGLVTNGGYDVNELVDHAVVAAKYDQTVDLFRVVGFGDVASDIVKKLISEGKQYLALKFIFEFELTGKFPPASLLESCVIPAKKIMKLGQKVCKTGKNSRRRHRRALNEAPNKQM